jgi:hypothetical protein
MKLPFRTHLPKRTYSGPELRPYQRYKDFLAVDFMNRCGYTDCPHNWFGGQRNFQIDHFLGLKKNPGLEFDYGNLVYACSYVNRAKSADENEYLDPCNTDYNKHFYRNELGEIFAEPNSKVANYMWKKLQLHLERYSLTWLLDNLKNRMELINAKIAGAIDEVEKEKLLLIQGELGSKFIQYFNYLEVQL